MISSKEFFVVIPARFDSSRFPGKVLEKINNISMLENVLIMQKKARQVLFTLLRIARRYMRRPKNLPIMFI